MTGICTQGVGNSTGWSELYSGDMIGAAYTVYNCSMPGWIIPILFFVFQVMLYLKTRNGTLMWVAGFFFVSMYATATFIRDYMETLSIQIMFLILVLELAGILFVWIMK